MSASAGRKELHAAGAGPVPLKRCCSAFGIENRTPGIAAGLGGLGLTP